MLRAVGGLPAQEPRRDLFERVRELDGPPDTFVVKKNHAAPRADT
jgi:hypothetical protein